MTPGQGLHNSLVCFAQRGLKVKALLNTIWTVTSYPKIASLVIGEVMHTLMIHSVHPDHEYDLTKSITALLYPTKGTLLKDPKPPDSRLRSFEELERGGHVFPARFKTRKGFDEHWADDPTKAPDWYNEFLPRYTYCSSSNIATPGRDNKAIRLKFDYCLRTDPHLASSVIYTMLKCDSEVLFDCINNGRHAALYYQLEFALDCLKRDVPIPDDWLVY